MKTSVILGLLLVLGFPALVLAQSPHDPAAVRAAIEGTLAQFSAAMKQADARTIASMYTEDGEYFSAATKGFTTGRVAIEDMFAARFKATRFIDVALTTVSLQVEGDTAYETGTNRVTFQAGDAPAVTRTARPAPPSSSII